MPMKIPRSLAVEHEALHAKLVALTKISGRVGEAARHVAAVLHPHFVKEEEYALPPLGLLVSIAQGGVTPEMRAAVAMTERLKKDLPEMLAEHQRAASAIYVDRRVMEYAVALTTATLSTPCTGRPVRGSMMCE